MNLPKSDRLSRQDDTENFLGTGMFKGFGAFVERGRGGGDVVDEPDDLSADVGSVFCGCPFKCVREVSLAFGSIVGTGLGGGEADAPKVAEQGCFGVGQKVVAQNVGEKLGLVESAPTEAQWMERNGAKKVGERDIRSAHTVQKECAKRNTEISDETVFVRVNGL